MPDEGAGAGHDRASASASSDDPGAAMQVMDSNSSLRALDQYQTNVQRASSRVDLEDSVLQQIGDLLTRAKELGVSQATDTASGRRGRSRTPKCSRSSSRSSTSATRKFGNEYLFGGDQSTTAPFASTGAGATLDYTTTNPQGQRSIEHRRRARRSRATHDGKQVFVDTGVLDAVKQLARSLDPTSATYGQAGIGAAMTSSTRRSTRVQTLVGDTGAQRASSSTTTRRRTSTRSRRTHDASSRICRTSTSRRR